MTPIRLALLALLLLAPAATAQETMRIAAVVNDEAISFRDLEARIHLVLVSSNIERTPENLRRAAPQVLRQLIDERLQIQEAKRLNLDASDAEIQDAFRRIEEQSNLPRGGIEEELDRAGISRASFTEQIRAGLVWQKIVRRQVAPRVQVGDDEVQDILAGIQRTKDVPEFRIVEILLGVDRPEREGEVRRFAEQLVDQARSGADFGVLARQFSEAASAAAGGEVGWVLANQLDEAIEREVTKAGADAIVGPIRTVAGFHIVRVMERRSFQAPNPDDAVVNLRQAAFPVGGGSEEEARRKLARIEGAKTCPEFEKLAEEAEAARPYSLGRLKVGDLNAALKPIVAPVEPGRMSPPTRVADSLVVFMVCDRTEPPSSVPKAEDVREQLFRGKLGVVARRYLRDLRRAAYLDLRT
jgi:peptidyl-prolyl cis-trans isomerase SurA